MKGRLGFTQERYDLTEGQPTTGQVAVERTGGSEGFVSVTVAAYPSLSSATVLPRVSGVGEDVAIARQTLTWADGETGPKSVEIDILDDTTPEGTEFVTLALSRKSPGTNYGQRIAELVIADNDTSESEAVVSTTELLPEVKVFFLSGTDVTDAPDTQFEYKERSGYVVKQGKLATFQTIVHVENLKPAFNFYPNDDADRPEESVYSRLFLRLPGLKNATDHPVALNLGSCEFGNFRNQNEDEGYGDKLNPSMRAVVLPNSDLVSFEYSRGGVGMSDPILDGALAWFRVVMSGQFLVE